MKDWVKINGELVSLNNIRVITDIGINNDEKFEHSLSGELSFDIVYEDGTEYQVMFPDSVIKDNDKNIVLNKLENVRKRLIEIIDVDAVEIINVVK